MARTRKAPWDYDRRDGGTLVEMDYWIANNRYFLALDKYNRYMATANPIDWDMADELARAANQAESAWQCLDAEQRDYQDTARDTALWARGG